MWVCSLVIHICSSSQQVEELSPDTKTAILYRSAGLPSAHDLVGVVEGDGLENTDLVAVVIV